MINATNSTKARELIPAGNYVARCYSMIHIGTVEEEVLGRTRKLNKVRISWELPTELRVFDETRGPQPMVISREYNLSMNEKANLRKDIEGWRGKAFTEEEAKLFDVTRLLGVPCMLNVIHKKNAAGNDYDSISGIGGMPKGQPAPDQVNPTFEWNYDDKFDQKALEQFPDFIKDKIKQSDEYRKLEAGIIDLTENDEPFSAPDDDDLPF